MADDLFASKRFKPGQLAAKEDDDSGENYRKTARFSQARVGEAEILAMVDQVPALPVVVTSILARVGSDQSSAADLEALIKQDMVIAGRLLKMVNSPFYGLTNPVASITQAVAIIGFPSLRSLVLAAASASVLAGDHTAYGFSIHGLWKNSMATAALAREIGLASGAAVDEAEELFIAGLLRDVGMLVIGQLLERKKLTLRRDRSGSQTGDILTRERALLGFDHCWVGDRIAERWRLPQDIALTVGRHHRPPSSLSAKQARQIAAVRLAERLTYAAAVGVVPGHPFDSHLDGTLIQSAGLAAASFEKLVTEVPGIISIAERLAV